MNRYILYFGKALPLLPFLPWQKCVNFPIAVAKEIGGKTACIVNGSLLSFKDVFRNDRHLGSNRDDVGPKIGFLRGRVTLKGYQKVK